MTAAGLAFGPYDASSGPAPGSVPVTVVILARDEELNIGRALGSVAWAAQTIVIDSGSTDRTVGIARDAGATVIHQPWLGFGPARKLALELPAVRHGWVYFVDADEWVSAALADEIAAILADPRHAGYRQRKRLVFLSRWIRHGGWYHASWHTLLLRRDRATFPAGDRFRGRALVDGTVGILRHDLVDQDNKSIASWLTKHVRYAQLQRAERARPLLPWLLARRRGPRDSRPLLRSLAAEQVYPRLPARPLLVFLYMYIARLGCLDGWPGFVFCFYRSWYEVTVRALDRESGRRPETPVTAG